MKTNESSNPAEGFDDEVTSPGITIPSMGQQTHRPPVLVEAMSTCPRCERRMKVVPHFGWREWHGVRPQAWCRDCRKQNYEVHYNRES